MLRVKFAFLAFICAAMLTPACKNEDARPDLPPLRDDGGEPRSLIPDQSPFERVSSENDKGKHWRDATRLEGGTPHTFKLEDLQAGDAVRIGVRESDGERRVPISVNVRWESREDVQLASDASGNWQDFKIVLPHEGDTANTGTLELSSESAFWLSHMEIVPYSQMNPSVIVVLIDTLRQDHLHCYGYERETSPNIDAFREDAVLFTGLVPPSSWTRPSVASLLTATYPGTNGVRDRGDRVRDDVTWLADVLEPQGYESHAILTNPNCIPVWGFGEDFDRAFEAHPNRWRYEDTDEEAVQLGRTTARDLLHRRHFMYLHAMAPHSPYDPPEAYLDKILGEDRRGFPKPLDRYDAEIAYFDALFGEFMDELKLAGTYDSSLIVVLSDHGEEFLEHGGTMHGATLYEEQLRVPLLIKFPNNERAGASWHGLLEMVDVAPTLLDILGVPSPPAFQGISVLPHLERDGEPKPIGYAELHIGKRSMRATKTLHAKYIDNIAEGTEHYFDLQSDPGELRPLTEAPNGAAPIKLQADKVAMLGNRGLHILITHDSAKTETIRAVLRSESLGELSVRYPDSLYELSREHESYADFTAKFPEATNPSVPSAHWQEAMKKNESLRTTVNNASPIIVLSEQNYAEIVVDIPFEGEFQLELFIGDEPFPAERIQYGREGARAPDVGEGGAIRVADAIASPAAYDPAALPLGTAAYIWYVPSQETIADDEMDPELRESLEALGYISE